ncbi:lytic transglycosylase domain-containing protein [Terasakiella sp. A23]|uniref:lytic transglycosylase domain-containing protein n=1 Tax=Terasakiella sp. FCG-A23 TaxID=3080561 RepID=UPI0029538658|nr:lytic transglycosylase domain-containing protein [Terasakiella sp. A23]MDV7338351.1 lytic transglycosylase domain-containing protein [Terasakiella sp. A23]
MKRILTFIWVLALFVAAAFISTVEAATRFEVKQMVMAEAADSNVPVSLALAVAKVESDFNARALSSAGARGVMQIMPDTARKEFGVHPKRLWNAETNIRLGVQFLEQLHDQYDGRWDLALSHYNGGTVRGDEPHSYTRKYVAKVQKWQRVYQEQANLWEGGREGDDFYDDQDDIDVAELREWRTRNDRYDDEDDGFERYERDERNEYREADYRNDDYYEDEVDYRDDGYGDTRIIIVERRADRGWRRPPPPSHHRGGRGHWGPPPRHFR